jgi:predicted lipid-binding transport protein (Tim44 family)
MVASIYEWVQQHQIARVEAEESAKSDRMPARQGFRIKAMPQGFDFSTLILLAIAGFVIWRLRSVLGQRTGAERPPQQEPVRRESAAEAKANDNVVPLPTTQKREERVLTPEQKWKGVTDPNSPAVAGLEAIAASDKSFDPRGFVDGARAAYEMIVVGFAKGDKATLKELLTEDVYASFAGVIDERASRNEKAEATFVSIEQSEVTEAELNGSGAEVTMRFVSKIISAVRNAAGEVIEGSADKVTDITDEWTFARDTRSRDPNWRVTATQ